MEEVIEIFQIAIPFAVLGVLAWLTKVLVDGVIGMLNIESGIIKRIVLFVVVILMLLAYNYRETTIVSQWIIPIIAISFLASGFDYISKEGDDE